MADGHLMHAATDDPSERLLTLDEAISQLEAGITDEIQVDLGNGRRACAEGLRGADGLLQRLRGHRMMLALVAGHADMPRFTPTELPTVSPIVQEILDAATAKR